MKHNLQDIDLKLLKIFRTIADCRGLTPAAQVLNTTLPAVSNALADLELRLGFALCHRGRAGFSLTPEGEQVYKAHSELLRNMAQFSNQLGDITNQLVGEVRLAVVDAASELPGLKLDQCIRTFKDRSPYTTVSMEMRPAREIEEAVVAGQIDIGISVRQRDISELESVQLSSERLGLYCGDTHPLFSEDPNTVSLEYVRTFERCYRDYIRFSDGRRRKELDIHTSKANNLEALALMVLSGRYLGYLPNYVADKWVDAGRMKSVRPDHFERVNDVVMFTRSGKTPSKAVAQFMADLVGTVEAQTT